MSHDKMRKIEQKAIDCLHEIINFLFYQTDHFRTIDTLV